MTTDAGKHKGNLFRLHLAVFLFGFAGLFGKWIAQPPVTIVFGRTFLAAAGLSLFLFVRKEKRPWHTGGFAASLLVSGAVLAFHWLAFFNAIRLASVTLAVLTFCTYPLFITLAEPLLFRTRLRLPDILVACALIGGVALLRLDSNPGIYSRAGLLWGLAAGFSFASLSLLNRALVQRLHPIRIAFFQNGFAALFLLPFFLPLAGRLTLVDVALLAVLGLACTALAHGLFIASLRSLTVRLAGLTSGLEPVYGIILAFLLLGEIPGTWTVAGGIVIVAAVAAGTASHFLPGKRTTGRD